MIAYLINQYPQASHSFIRREILAIEQLGTPVARFSIRRWDTKLVDENDRAEQSKTRYVLDEGVDWHPPSRDPPPRSSAGRSSLLSDVGSAPFVSAGAANAGICSI